MGYIFSNRILKDTDDDRFKCVAVHEDVKFQVSASIYLSCTNFIAKAKDVCPGNLTWRYTM